MGEAQSSLNNISSTNTSHDISCARVKGQEGLDDESALANMSICGGEVGVMLSCAPLKQLTAVPGPSQCKLDVTGAVKDLSSRLPEKEVSIDIAQVQPLESRDSSSQVQTPDVQFSVSINHMHIPSPGENMENKVDLSIKHEEKVKCVIHCSNDIVKLSIHLYQGISHQLLTSNAPIQMVQPSCKKVGKVRKNYIIPYFTDRENWQLCQPQFDKVMHAIQQYDRLNGQTTPGLDNWTDAFSDIRGQCWNDTFIGP